MSYVSKRILYQESAIVTALGLWVLYEGCLGLLQLAGFLPAGHKYFCMTGGFSNPGPYGGFIAVTASVAIGYGWKNRKQLNIPFWMSVATVFTAIIILPATGSRAAWVALLVSLSVFVIKETDILRRLKRHWVFVTTLAIMLSMLGGVGLFFMKKDSALGRLHIWHIEALAICSNPLRGVGIGNALGAYGETQAAYFSETERTETERRIAGCPEYPFNEYLGIGMESGILGMVLSFIIASLSIITLGESDSSLLYGMTAIFVFAFFSYPLYVWQLKILTFFFLTFASIGLIKKKRLLRLSILVLSLAILAVPRLRCLSHTENYDYHFMYEKGKELFDKKDYANSLVYLKKGESMSCDPAFQNLMGRCYEAMGNKPEAERQYWKSHYMVPCRIYPLILLLNLYNSEERVDEALRVAEMARSISVNPKNITMTELHEEAECYIIEHGHK